MNELHVTLGDRSYSFGDGETVRIGRSTDNDIVISDPTVSRQHAELTQGPGGWEFANVGRALSFLNGEPVTRARLTGPARIQLSSERGPVLSITVSGADPPRPASAADRGDTAVSGYPASGYPDSGYGDDSAWPGLPPLPASLGPSELDFPAPAARPPTAPQPVAPQSVAPQPVVPQSVAPQPVVPQPVVPQSDSPQAGYPYADVPPAAPRQDQYSPSGFPEGGFPAPAESDQPEGFPQPAFPDAALPELGSTVSGFPASGFQEGTPPPAAPGVQPDYLGQPDQPVNPSEPARPDYLDQPGHPDYLNHPGQPDYLSGSAAPDAHGQPDQPDYQNQLAQPDYLSQPAYPAYQAYPGQPDSAESAAALPHPDSDQPDRTSVLDSSAIRDSTANPAYPGDPAYPGYPGDPGYPADPAHPPGTGYPGGAGYPPGGGYPGGDAPPRIRPVAGQPVDEIATALHILVPIRSWLHDPGWRQFLRLLVIPYGLLPLIFIALFASSSNLATPGWAYSLYIAPLWAIAFWLLIRPGKVERQEVMIGIGAIVFSLVWIRLITVHLNDVMGAPGKPLPFFGAIGVGINEEVTKALPILLAALLLLKYRSIKLDVRMWMFLGAIVGLAFGVTEQAGYTLQDIQGITAAQANSQAIVEVLAFAERVFVDGFQHAMWAGVSAFFIGIAVNYPRRRVQLIAFGIAVPAVLHGLYDWSAGAFASLWIPIIIQLLSLFLFLGYTMSAAAIERQVRRTPMFRGESMLMERFTDRGESGQHSRTGSGRTGSGRAGSIRTGDNWIGAQPTGADRAGVDRAGVDRAGVDRAGVDRADRASADRTSADRASADRTSADRASADRTDSDWMGRDQPGDRP